jgi:hypothetical protein
MYKLDHGGAAWARLRQLQVRATPCSQQPQLASYRKAAGTAEPGGGRRQSEGRVARIGVSVASVDEALVCLADPAVRLRCVWTYLTLTVLSRWEFSVKKYMFQSQINPNAYYPLPRAHDDHPNLLAVLGLHRDPSEFTIGENTQLGPQCRLRLFRAPTISINTPWSPLPVLATG